MQGLNAQDSFVAILTVTTESDGAEKILNLGDTDSDSYHITQVKARLAETTLRLFRVDLYHYTLTVQGVELRPSVKHTQACIHTHLMVTTWLDQNKAFRQALFTAELIFLKQLRGKELFSRTCRLFFFFFQSGGLDFKNFYLCTSFGPILDRD